MIRPIARLTAALTLMVPATFAWLGGCDVSNAVIAETYEAGTPSFVSFDAAPPEVVEGGLTSYCPSSECPKGWTTCVRSRFRCDVDLLTDRFNCGECGHACVRRTERPGELFTETYECVEGRCVMQCSSPGPKGIPALDCDGLPDNGCEIIAVSNDNCGACGIKCPDPTKPCVQRLPFSTDIGCGCHGDDLYCSELDSPCVRWRIDDQNCGACGHACDPNGDGGVVYPNMSYGCSNGECGHLKCKKPWANCDGDISNGCEASLVSSENCGACGNACAPGLICGNGPNGLECVCPPGRTYCGGWCVDLTTDSLNCGACGIGCSMSCTYGVCNNECPKGLADCNGNELDACETNTDQDPMNCGACGRVCDAVAGQACVGGACVVEPCDRVQDAGEITR